MLIYTGQAREVSRPKPAACVITLKRKFKKAEYLLKMIPIIPINSNASASSSGGGEMGEMNVLTFRYCQELINFKINKTLRNCFKVDILFINYYEPKGLKSLRWF